VDLFHEPFWQVLLVGMGQLGDWHGVEAAWQECQRLFRRELGTPPSEETVAKYREARNLARSVARRTSLWSNPMFGNGWRLFQREDWLDRPRETERFLEWLEQNHSPVFNVWGPAGMGKTTLLRHSAGLCAEKGQPAVFVDGQAIAPEPTHFLHAATHAHPDPWRWLEQTEPVVFVDTWEAIAPLATFFADTLLVRGGQRVRFVVAGRHPLREYWSATSPARRLLTELPLATWTPDESRAYLQRRGLVQTQVVEAIVQACGGLPLALSLASDLARQHETLPLERTGAWHGMVEELARHLLEEIADERLRRLVEACSVVRHIPEGLLHAFSRHLGVPPRHRPALYRQLTSYSALQPTAHGIGWHEAVRQFLAQHFAWRDPDGYRGVQQVAWAYYQARLAAASPAEREWLTQECLFLTQNAMVHRLLFRTDLSQSVETRAGRPEEIPICQAIWAAWAAPYFQRHPPASRIEYVRHVLRHPLARWRTLWQEGQMVGFWATVPVRPETHRLLAKNPTFRPLVEWCGQQQPSFAAGGEPLFICYAATVPAGGASAQAALFRDLVRVLTQEKPLLAATPSEDYRKVLLQFGYQEIPELRNFPYGKKTPCRHYVLDIRSKGFYGWVVAQLGWQMPPSPVSDGPSNGA
jgi:energy-coupling factor transporter ATP-binding protein EcfA2